MAGYGNFNTQWAAQRWRSSFATLSLTIRRSWMADTKNHRWIELFHPISGPAATWLRGEAGPNQPVKFAQERWLRPSYTKVGPVLRRAPGLTIRCRRDESSRWLGEEHPFNAYCSDPTAADHSARWRVPSLTHSPDNTPQFDRPRINSLE